MKHTFLKTVIILFSILIVNKLNAQLYIKRDKLVHFHS